MTTDRERICRAALAVDQIAARRELAQYSAIVFRDAGEELNLVGHMLGADRRSGSSPFGHGDDATVAISMLLRIAGQLVSASADLLLDGRCYAGSALIRQLVEVEYLAWAFEAKNEESARGRSRGNSTANVIGLSGTFWSNLGSPRWMVQRAPSWWSDSF
jgi:hypothetical protein